jgi:hypothetical protein
MFAGQNDGMLHSVVADVNPGKPSAGSIPILVAAQGDGPVRLVMGSRLRVARPLCTVLFGSSVESAA